MNDRFREALMAIQAAELGRWRNVRFMEKGRGPLPTLSGLFAVDLERTLDFVQSHRTIFSRYMVTAG